MGLASNAIVLKLQEPFNGRYWATNVKANGMEQCPSLFVFVRWHALLKLESSGDELLLESVGS